MVITLHKCYHFSLFTDNWLEWQF